MNIETLNKELKKQRNMQEALRRQEALSIELRNILEYYIGGKAK